MLIEYLLEKSSILYSYLLRVMEVISLTKLLCIGLVKIILILWIGRLGNCAEELGGDGFREDRNNLRRVT